MSAPSLAQRKLLDITDMINTVKYLNGALFMACGDVADHQKTNALQAVCDEVEARILIIVDRIEELREELA
ncbi:MULTISPECIES: hypothetical protein [Rhizobium/Agrobacterium group]|uniref:hypothetical protein n=1 Tax=Rhizobium/Agrobacterium group TaxID=227290 RepID=UPI000DD79E31|nr:MULTISPECIES: hypothetical protein [Rhizobium/Agrobacterium group]MBB4402565.1 hypothetical protein [Agrobacterium radiobacter]MBB5588719.1 hypothetical protein [Agrobacterium radiobacter]NTZ90435.1 hypothetical protein [Agrobacterium tumefaciens]TGE89158.1 hypothetical protein C9418_12450 [Rhizobium sp. SEMIA 4032]